MGCFFRTTTSAKQTLMYADKTAFGSVTRHAKLHLIISGSTVKPAMRVYSSTGPTFSQVTSSGTIGISDNYWHYAAGWWDDGGNMGVILVRAEHVSYEDTIGTVSFTTGNLSRFSIGSEYAGLDYMNGQIAHACFWDSRIDKEQCEHIAEGRFMPPATTAYFGSANDSLIYHFPLTYDESASYGGQKKLSLQGSPTWSDADPNACEPLYQQLVL